MGWACDRLCAGDGGSPSDPSTERQALHRKRVRVQNVCVCVHGGVNVLSVWSVCRRSVCVCVCELGVWRVCGE